MKIIITLSGLALLMSCATVRQQDLDAWVGVPVGALDTHSIFITPPLIKTMTPQGIEIRNYPNKRNFARCSGGGRIKFNGYSTYANYNGYTVCTANLVGCDNIFYFAGC